MFTLVLILSSALQAQEPKSPQAPADRGTAKGEKDGKPKAEVAAATPEQALRTFLVAMMTKDETTLREVTVPTDDFDWLLKGQAVPAEHVEEFKAQMARQPIRTLKPGDEFTLPGNRKMTIQASEVTADRAILVPEGAPVPNRVRKVDGRWRVDATPIIAGRKAADAARKKAADAANKKAARPDL
jgi:hypothetical protein